MKLLFHVRVLIPHPPPLVQPLVGIATEHVEEEGPVEAAEFVRLETARQGDLTQLLQVFARSQFRVQFDPFHSGEREMGREKLIIIIWRRSRFNQN